MMFTNMYVHILEVVVALLVVATVVQLFRANRSLSRTTPTPNVLPTTASDFSQTIEKNYSRSANILHDYIGEFFTDEVRVNEAIATDLKAYKNADVAKVNLVNQAKFAVAAIKDTAKISEELDNDNKRSNIFNFEECAEVTSDKSNLDDEDDSVITVMSASKASKDLTDDKVMSDKVVHAMLDEAKLVCAS